VLAPWLDGGNALIQVWTNGLRMLVIPLVVTQLFVTLAGHRSGTESSRMGWSIPAVFVGLLLFTAAVAIAQAVLLLRLPVLSGMTLSSVIPDAPTVAPEAAAPFQWIIDLVPANLFAAATANAILPLMLFTFAFALAARRLAPPLLASLHDAASAVRETMFVLVGWLMRLAPPILFVLAFRSGSRFGLEVGGALAAFLVIWSIALVGCLAAQYPLTWLVTGVSMRRFARAMFPGQVAAFASRSSVATVPILLKESETALGIPPQISSLVVPTGAAVLKLSQAVSPPLRLLFLAHVLGITLTMNQVIVFILTIIVLSPGIAGVPRMVSSQGKSLPAYIAAGVPPEYVLLLAPLNAIVDPLLTVLNASGYLTANVMVARRVLGKAGFRTVTARATAASAPVHDGGPSLPASPKLN
jgi:Na+/H+-dicarboxylate symporter